MPEHKLMVGGRERRFLLDVPKRLKPGAGLILVCHGFGDSPEAIRTYSGFLPLLESHNFVFVYLEGTKDKEGKRNHQVEYAFQDPKIDDVAYARRVVQQVVANWQLSEQRVFCTGMSNGADLSFYLARQPKAFVRAIAPIAGTMMTTWDKHLKTANRIPIMEVHGTADEITLWQGDMTNRDGWGAYLSVEGTAKWWVEHLALEKKDVSTHGSVTTTRWWTARDAVEYQFYKIAGGKHVWPEHLGDPKTTLAMEILAFFERHGGVDRK